MTVPTSVMVGWVKLRMIDFSNGLRLAIVNSVRLWFWGFDSRLDRGWNSGADSPAESREKSLWSLGDCTQDLDGVSRALEVGKVGFGQGAKVFGNPS